MVNLPKCNERAEYVEGKDPRPSRREADERYGVEVRRLLVVRGGGPPRTADGMEEEPSVS